MGIDAQLKKTDEVIASNEAIADVISELNNTFRGTLASGFSMIATGLQEVYFSIDDGFREVSYKLDLQNEALAAIKEILERPLDTQAKELRKRAEFAYLNGWIDEAEVDLLESVRKNYQDFIALHILGNIYYHKKNHQKAMEYYQKAAKYAAPQSVEGACKALLCMAKLYYELGRREDAHKSTKMAMELPFFRESSSANSPECVKVLYNHSAYASAMKYTEESIDYLKKAAI
jgi:tetratricopeptide (TPR) repeat protein